MDESLIIVIHGYTGAGKSPLAFTSPAPRLVLDAENGTRFVRGAKRIAWNPVDGPPPEHDGSWDTCVVQVRDFSTMKTIYAWLARGEHPFVSVVFDSLTEIQKRCRDAIGGESTLHERQWGDLLIQMEKLVRDFRDLTMHPTRPIRCLVLVSLSQERDGRVKPLLQGALAKNLPGFVDVIGYLAAYADEAGEIKRRMLVSPHTQYEAKDRTGLFGVALDAPDLADMLSTIGKEND